MNNMTHLTPDDPSDGPVEKRLKTKCRKVADDFYPMLLDRAQQRIPLLPRGVEYKSQHIFGEEFWRLLREHASFDPRRIEPCW